MKKINYYAEGTEVIKLSDEFVEVIILPKSSKRL